MNSLKKVVKNILLLLLFFAALLKTYEGITGIKLIPLLEGRKTETDHVSLNTNHSEKLLGNIFKFLQHVFPEELHVSSMSSEEPISIPIADEDTDWTQYPSTVVEATGYTAGYESTGKHPDHPEFGITYSGVKVTRDLFSTVAADLNIFPIGTILYIPGYGYGVVADKGGAIKGKKVDLYYETVEDVYENWGKKTVEVYIIKMGDGNLTEDDLRALNENESLQVLRQKFIESKGQ